MSFRFPQPSNEDDFEEFYERLLQKHFGCRTLPQYRKHGEEQLGIDSIDTAYSEPFLAAQRKHHESIVAVLKQQLTAQRIYQDMVSEHGFSGSPFELCSIVRLFHKQYPLAVYGSSLLETIF